LSQRCKRLHATVNLYPFSFILLALVKGMLKIPELLARDGETCVSFEFFPPKSMDGVESLVRRIHEMAEQLRPTFVSLTWRSAFRDEDVWLRIGQEVSDLGITVLLHLTCHLPRDDLVRILQKARERGLCNILALRGDSAHFAAGSAADSGSWGAVNNGFNNAIELVRLIRSEHGDHFCIGVAGYPEVHTSAWNSPFLPPSDQAKRKDLMRLKEKIEAGADFVITQFVYEPVVFADFKERCDEIGIYVPIIAGYAPIQNYSSFERFRRWVHPRVPSEVVAKLDQIKDNDEEVQSFGVDVGAKQCSELLKADTPGIHFFTLNLAGAVRGILLKLKLRDAESMSSRELPWLGLPRVNEEIRPIFWQYRHASYVSRTSKWNEYPNGRWGNVNNSAATFELSDYYLAEKDRSSLELRKLWKCPQNHSEVANVFLEYMQGKIDVLPWCDEQPTAETETISESLCWINENGFLTINSQPRVNGAPSNDKRYGWGGSGGSCFQKPYVEFFCSPELWFKLKSVIQQKKSNRFSFHAINYKGDEFLDSGAKQRFKATENKFADELVKARDSRPGRVNAVTWGVFPGREIIQPTVVDTETFRVWKNEAFELWKSAWAAIYEPKDGLPQTPDEEKAVKVLTEIQDNWFLVNIVDNDYVSESDDIFDLFRTVILDDMTPEQLRARVHQLENKNNELVRKLLRAEGK